MRYKTFSLLEVNRNFGGTYRFHLQGQKINQATNQHEAGRKQRALGLSINLEDGGDMLLPNIG
jgi:hypothetical protein